MEQIVFSPVPLQELLDRIEQIVEDRLNRKEQQQNADKLLTAAEVCQMLDITRPTLWSWTKQGKLKQRRLGNRIYYRQGDILQQPSKQSR
jgi:predicted DNA-binding transcriptional regulator AlpA